VANMHDERTIVQSNIQVSQRSVATDLRRGGIFNSSVFCILSHNARINRPTFGNVITTKLSGCFFLIRGVHSGVYSGRYEELLRRRRLRRPSATTTATATINNERQQGKRTKTDKDMI